MESQISTRFWLSTYDEAHLIDSFRMRKLTVYSSISTRIIKDFARRFTSFLGRR